jgi:hypothetical protein
MFMNWQTIILLQLKRIFLKWLMILKKSENQSVIDKDIFTN